MIYEYRRLRIRVLSGEVTVYFREPVAGSPGVSTAFAVVAPDACAIAARGNWAGLVAWIAKRPEAIVSVGPWHEPLTPELQSLCVEAIRSAVPEDAP